MPDRPVALDRLDHAFRVATVVHEYVAELARDLPAIDPSDDRWRELLRESARIVTLQMPELTAHLRGLERRWIDESVLDPAAAERTEVEIEAEYGRIADELEALVRRQDRLAKDLRQIVNNARGAGET